MSGEARESRNADASLEAEYALLREYEKRKLAYTEAIHGRLGWETDKSIVEVTSEEVDAAEHWLDAFVTPLIRRAALRSGGDAPASPQPERDPSGFWITQEEYNRLLDGVPIDVQRAEPAAPAEPEMRPLGGDSTWKNHGFIVTAAPVQDGGDDPVNIPQGLNKAFRDFCIRTGNTTAWEDPEGVIVWWETWIRPDHLRRAPSGDRT
jgi:hypothetical protein